MLWDLLRYPAHDARAQLYWRRRVSVLGAGVAVLLLLVVLLLHGGSHPAKTTQTAAEPQVPAGVGGPGGQPEAGALGPAAAPPVSPTPTPTTSPSASANPADSSTNCPPGTVALQVAADAASYPAGKSPVLALTVVDTGTAACSVDLGTASTSITVLSDGKPVWSSSTCEPKAARSVRLNPAAAQMMQMTWNRTRNASGCGPAATTALPAGRYELIAKLGTMSAYGGDLTLG